MSLVYRKFSRSFCEELCSQLFIWHLTIRILLFPFLVFLSSFFSLVHARTHTVHRCGGDVNKIIKISGDNLNKYTNRITVTLAVIDMGFQCDVPSAMSEPWISRTHETVNYAG